VNELNRKADPEELNMVLFKAKDAVPTDAASREMRTTHRGSKHEVGASRIEVYGRRAPVETNVRILRRWS
jgi:hypothetical protein